MNFTTLHWPWSDDVVIGTTAPSKKLAIAYSDSATNDGVLVSNSGTLAGELMLENTGAGGRRYGLLSTGSGNNPGAGTFSIFDFTDGTLAGFRLNINSSGNVGIGTTSPGADLDVQGTSYPGDPGRIRFTASPGGDNLDLYVGVATGSTDGNAACQRYSANAVCLAYWSSGGVLSSCGTVQGNGRALCVDFP